jgi:LysR family transcriptional regulator for metE and metH
MSVHMLEVRHLRLVRAIAEEGGPTRAAARLHLTQSAVSHQLAELERRLGVTLFARVRRKLTPTPAGARLLEEARTLLAELARVERDLHRAGERKRETLRIVVECFTNYYWLPGVVAELARDAPHVDVRICPEATREPVSALLRGAVDVAIVTSLVVDRSLVAAPLFGDEWAVVVPRSHPLAARAWVSAVELGKETLLSHDATRRDVERLRDLVAAERASMPRVISVPLLTDVLVDFVKTGLGVGLMSRWAATPYVARGEIVARRFTRGGLLERWVALSRRNGKGSHVHRFIELTRALGAPPPDRGGTRATRQKS